MRILVAAQTKNPIIPEMAAALAECPPGHSVVMGHEPFWSAGEDEFEVLHLHWPEALFGWKPPTAADLERLEARLRWWRERAVVVVTVHNLQAHDPSRRAAYDPAYELLFRYAHGLVHMGRSSIAPITSRFPSARTTRHAVIPLAMYSGFPNETTREQARARLRLKPDDFVALSFGTLRQVGELQVLLDGFKRAKVPGKRLLVAGNVTAKMTRAQRLRTRAAIWLDPGVRTFFDFVDGADVQYFFNAADVVVIPRIENLNSANVILGFAFARVVVGPDKGVSGEILRDTGNPVYRPGDPDSLAEALARASRMDRRSKEAENRAVAEREWDPRRVAAMHLDFYQELDSLSRDGARRGAGSVALGDAPA